MFMTVNIESVQITIASEHLMLVGLVLFAVLPKFRHLRKKK